MALNLYANNASNTLNGAITNVATSITLNDASEFDAIGAGEQYYITVTDGTNIEIMLATALSTNTFTVIRGQQGTSNVAFADGSLVEQRVTAGDLDNFVQMAETGAIDFGGATSLEIPNGAAPTVNAAGEIAVDTTITDYTGMIKYYDGTEELVVAGMPTANLSTTDRSFIKYNASNNELEMGLVDFIGFSATRPTTQSISTATSTKIQLDTEQYDTEGDFDSTTNYRHTPSLAGKWLYLGLCSTTLSDQRLLFTDIYKNGIAAASGTQYVSAAGSGAVIMQNTVVLEMNGSTDYVELYMYHNEGSSVNTLTGASSCKLVGVYLGDS